MHRAFGRAAAVVVLAAAMAIAVAAPAGAFGVKGHQKPVGPSKYRMTGDLRGKWRVTAFHVLSTNPVLRGKGKERFNGCLDLARDHSCSGDPSGKLFFTFRYWAIFDEGDAPELGTCAHPVVGGTGSFAGATGFLMMVDTPIRRPPGIKTAYEGELNLGLARSAALDLPGTC